MKPAKKAAAHHKPARPHKKARPVRKLRHPRAHKKAVAPKRARHQPKQKQHAGRAKAAPGTALAEAYTPDEVDTRDRVYVPRSTEAPAFVDLAPDLPPVWHQGEDSCVWYAVAAVHDYACGCDSAPAVAEQIRDAAKVHACVEYLSVGDLQSCLSDRLPVVFGITLFGSFAAEPTVYDPAPDETLLGPHSMVAVGIGYGSEWAGQFPAAEPDTRYVKVRNSWGTDAHESGYLLIPLEHLRWHGADFWTMKTNQRKGLA